MLHSKLFPLIFFALILISCNNQPKSTPQGPIFKKSFISLMPGGEPDDLKEFAPIHPSVIAWGSDPISSDLDVQRFSKDIAIYREMGLPLIASNVWMLTATAKYIYEHPEYQAAVCVDITGKPIVPTWLDSDYKGVLPMWGCTNNPLYRSLIKERASVGIKSGANMLHLDDHMGTCAATLHSAGCFCDYCMADFNDWLKEKYTKEKLVSLGIANIDSFRYSKIVKDAGFTTKASFLNKGAKDSIPLFNDFLSFQRDAVAGLVRELSEMADSIAGKHVPIGVNAWNLIPTQFATSYYADYFCNEIDHYDVEDLIPPFAYMLGNALHKPVFSTATGQDWVKIKLKESPVRIQRWIATAYAFGNYFMYAYNQWGFSEETGTQWYQFPMETFESYSSFITEHPALFDDFEDYNQVAVLYDNKAFRLGDESAREISRQLHYAQIPVGLAILGDEWLKSKLTPEKLSQFEYLIIPEKTILSNSLDSLFVPFSKNNKLIRWSDEIELQSIIHSPLKVLDVEKVWAIPRVKVSNTQNSGLVIHLLNQDFNNENDKMNKKTNFKVFVSSYLLGKQGCSSIYYYTPGHNRISLEFTDQNEGITVNIPFLDIWGIIKIILR